MAASAAIARTGDGAEFENGRGAVHPYGGDEIALGHLQALANDTLATTANGTTTVAGAGTVCFDYLLNLGLHGRQAY